jgi:hypothetical protein
MSIPDVILQPNAYRGVRGWHPEVIVRHAGTLERLARYVHSEPCLNRAVALQEAEEYAREWRLDFDRQHGAGYSEVILRAGAAN